MAFKELGKPRFVTRLAVARGKSPAGTIMSSHWTWREAKERALRSDQLVAIHPETGEWFSIPQQNHPTRGEGRHGRGVTIDEARSLGLDFESDDPVDEEVIARAMAGELSEDQGLALEAMQRSEVPITALSAGLRTSPFLALVRRGLATSRRGEDADVYSITEEGRKVVTAFNKRKEPR